MADNLMILQGKKNPWLCPFGEAEKNVGPESVQCQAHVKDLKPNYTWIGQLQDSHISMVLIINLPFILISSPIHILSFRIPTHINAETQKFYYILL